MKTQEKHKRVVFCDFDGTITRQETFVAMLNRFAPEKMKEFGEKIFQKKITLKQGVRGVVESIQSSHYTDMVAYIRDKEIRPGFEELLVFLKDADTPFIVISGGLKDSVELRLESYMDFIDGIYAPNIDTSEEFLKIVSDFEEEDELMAKVRVMDLFPCDQSICIGDGATDQKMALHSTLVFARDRLAAFLDKKQVRYVPWENFSDIKKYLIQTWHE
ncbi:MAG: HAD-IB family phosphatase [Proteobacteria bacterium]|nr:HAD-IB family phosphatase [Pseudomonadota bacterium]MBU1387858.1 HAD-IB family phosphatase [Pseudomonadota bacterium]MBU1543235.1 HAD-IB family phosphatase [Pseudomonadota bacterium]MBU2482468.1 HAD-IB family phosphatase [Pseudomonadota bacterium]